MSAALLSFRSCLQMQGDVLRFGAWREEAISPQRPSLRLGFDGSLTHADRAQRTINEILLNPLP